MPAHQMPLWVLSAVAASIAGVALGSGDISLSIQEPRVVRGVNASVIVSCSGPAGVMWVNPAGEQITKSMRNRIHQESNHKKGVSLVLELIEKQDRGNYTCRATVDGKPVSASFELLVINPLSFADTPTEQTAEMHSNVVLRCEVLGDFEISVTWQRDGKMPEGPRYKIVNDGLTIMNATLEDEGVYVCRAYQVSHVATSTLDRNITLRVEHAPMWVEEENPGVWYGLVGGVVNLTCVARAYPRASFMWLRAGKPLLPSAGNVSLFEADNVGVLQLQVRNHSWFGNYTCSARNKLGGSERSLVLQEGTKPRPPASVAVEAADGDSVSLDIEEEEDDDDDEEGRGELVTLGYRVQYRRKGTNLTWEHADFVDLKKGAKPYHISGLAQNVDYEMRVATRNAAGYSDFSEPLSYKNPQAQAEHVSSPAASNKMVQLLPLAGLPALLRWL